MSLYVWSPFTWLQAIMLICLNVGYQETLCKILNILDKRFTANFPMELVKTASKRHNTQHNNNQYNNILHNNA